MLYSIKTLFRKVILNYVLLKTRKTMFKKIYTRHYTVKLKTYNWDKNINIHKEYTILLLKLFLSQTFSHCYCLFHVVNVHRALKTTTIKKEVKENFN